MPQSRERFLLFNVVGQAWLNRLADALTINMFAALWFYSREEAEHWLNEAPRAPTDKQDYIVQRTITTIQEVEDEQE